MPYEVRQRSRAWLSGKSRIIYVFCWLVVTHADLFALSGHWDHLSHSAHAGGSHAEFAARPKAPVDLAR